MNKTLNIVFLIGANELQEGPKNYRSTILNYKSLCGGSFSGIPIAYVKIPDNNKALLPDVVDFLLDNDVKPIAVEEGFDGRVFPHIERTRDILKIFGNPEIAINDFILFVSNGHTVEAKQFAECLLIGIKILTTNSDIVSVGFENPSVDGRSLGQFIARDSISDRPIIVRTRDMMIAAKLAVDNASQFANATSYQAIGYLLSTFSYHPNRFISFIPQIAYST